MKARHVSLVNVLLYPLSFPPVGKVFDHSVLVLAKRQSVKPQQTISIEPYNVCNLRCKMCLYETMTRKKEQMSMKLYEKIIDDAVGNGIKDLNLTNFLEPLLDSLLFERIRYAKSKGLSVRFFSNGTVLTEEKNLQILDSGVDKITFSFDGATKESYESTRVGANFEETRDNIIQLIEERNKRHLKLPFISIGMAIQKDNQFEVSDFINFWKNLADEVLMWNVFDIKGLDLLPEELKIRARRPYPCAQLVCGGLVVLSNGKIPLCCMDCDGLIELGNLNKQTIREVMESSTYRDIIEKHLQGKGDSIELCSKCEYLYLGGYQWYLRAFPQIATAYDFAKRLLAKV